MRVAVKPGQIISLRVEAHDSDAATYKVTAKAASPSGFESEPNQSTATASTLTLSKMRLGIANDNETDYYSYKADADRIYAVRTQIKSDSLNDNPDGGDVDLSEWIKGEQYSMGTASYGNGWTYGHYMALKKGQTVYAQIDRS